MRSSSFFRCRIRCSFGVEYSFEFRYKMYLLRSYFKSLRAILYLKFILSRKPMAIVDKNNIEKIKILYLTSNVPKFELCIFFFFFCSNNISL